MTRDDIIRMAREAELPACHLTHPKALERFAAIVSTAERNRCAKFCADIIRLKGLTNLNKAAENNGEPL